MLKKIEALRTTQLHYARTNPLGHTVPLTIGRSSQYSCRPILQKRLFRPAGRRFCASHLRKASFSILARLPFDIPFVLKDINKCKQDIKDKALSLE